VTAGRVSAAPVTPVPAVNLPNALTLSRLVIVPVFAVVLVTGESTASRVLALVLFVLACATDLVDGWLARRWGQVTAFGVMVDPVADKALIGTALVALSLLGRVPWWATAIILGRELAVTALRVAVLRHGLLPAHRGGKLKCLTQNLAVVLFLLPLPAGADRLSLAVLAVAVACTVATGLDYLARAVQLRRAALTGAGRVVEGSGG
jgi:CDP-diacylglycerol---glycerol-3-phosphate 3-phosphatidyltransferase